MEKDQNVETVNNNKYNSIMRIVIVLLLFIVIALGISLLLPIKINKESSKYRLNGNSLQDFDLYFLKLENEEKNKAYSPIAIKYALKMLQEGSVGNSKKQITDVIGTYDYGRYTNTETMSFVNALFVRDSLKDKIKSKYISSIKDKYDADVIYDSFNTSDKINSWVGNRTFNLIDNMVDDISDKNFVLLNTLAIDMDWENKIQDSDRPYFINYHHRKFLEYIGPLNAKDYTNLKFNDNAMEAKAVKISAVANRYDIINSLGMENIRQNVINEYKKWLEEGAPKSCSGDPTKEMPAKVYVDKYLQEIDIGYDDVTSSTDFMFYTDDDVKVFAKDLKEYNGITLQYVGIMPTKVSLKKYIDGINSSDINNLINNLKGIELDSFKDGVITKVEGTIPVFDILSRINLEEDLNKLGITDVFDSKKANLSNLIDSNVYLDSIEHKVDVDFSNDGIKEADPVTLEGLGSSKCGFDYLYEVPIESIDLTFDKPYLFLVRDKNSGEVWFTGTVYEPIEYSQSLY